MKRRSFLGSLLALAFVPSLIEKIKPKPLFEWSGDLASQGKDAYEAYYTYGSDLKFRKVYSKPLTDMTEAENAEFRRIMEADLQEGLNHAQQVYNGLMAEKMESKYGPGFYDLSERERFNRLNGTWS